jgi:PBSX family phage terminase large subunit
LRTEFIDNPELNLKCFHFSIDDNPFLDPRYVADLKNEYTGFWYKRFIEGLWIAAEGAIYGDAWKDSTVVDGIIPHTLSRRIIGVDYGTTNPMVFLDSYLHEGKLLVDKEYYWDSATKQKQKTDSQYADDLERFIDNDKRAEIILDPSAASFKAELRSRGYHVVDAQNDVSDGIRVTSQKLERGLVHVNRRCTKTIEEHQTYSWNPKRAAVGVEEPIKTHDHTCDALRYIIYTRMYRLLHWASVVGGN